MVKYTEEQLVELRTAAVVPTIVDFAEFTSAIEEQRVFQEQHAEEHEPGTRRRSSHHGLRPTFKIIRKPKEKVFVQPDEDGWVTLNTKRGSVSGEDATQSRDEFREASKSSVARARPNNKNISSSQPAHASDVTSDKPKSKFNAFAALDSEEEDEDDSEDDE